MEGVKYGSPICCDELVSLPKVMVTHFVGILSPNKLRLLESAPLIALQIHTDLRE